VTSAFPSDTNTAPLILHASVLLPVKVGDGNGISSSMGSFWQVINKIQNSKSAG